MTAEDPGMSLGGAADPADLAMQLRLLKERTGMSFSQLASRSWYSRSALERYLNGKVFPPRAAVAAISESCGGDTRALLELWERSWLSRDGHRRDPVPVTDSPV